MSPAASAAANVHGSTAVRLSREVRLLCQCPTQWISPIVRLMRGVRFVFEGPIRQISPIVRFFWEVRFLCGDPIQLICLVVRFFCEVRLFPRSPIAWFCSIVRLFRPSDGSIFGLSCSSGLSGSWVERCGALAHASNAACQAGGLLMPLTFSEVDWVGWVQGVPLARQRFPKWIYAGRGMHQAPTGFYCFACWLVNVH